MENNMKRKMMYLDLKSELPSKRNKLLSHGKPELLSSPDVQMLKLASPELEKYIISNHSLVTPTQVFFPKNVTEEQELYAKGFVDALAQLQESSNSSCSEDSTSTMTSTTIKQEVPTNCSPIDMESQEKQKLERKRQRNRIAASKCRKRKLERISKLEDKVKNLKSENDNLNSVLDKLRDSVEKLKGKIMDHVNSGCQIMVKNE